MQQKKKMSNCDEYIFLLLQGIVWLVVERLILICIVVMQNHTHGQRMMSHPDFRCPEANCLVLDPPSVRFMLKL